MFAAQCMARRFLSIHVLVPVSEGLLDQAQERLKETSYLFGRVCDELHPEACYCLSMLAKVTFLQGQAAEVGHCTDTASHSPIHTHIHTFTHRRRWQRARQHASLSGQSGLSCPGGTPRHSARRNQGFNQQPVQFTKKYSL